MTERAVPHASHLDRRLGGDVVSNAQRGARETTTVYGGVATDVRPVTPMELSRPSRAETPVRALVADQGFVA